jgi:signal transduction histidine kinase
VKPSEPQDILDTINAALGILQPAVQHIPPVLYSQAGGEPSNGGGNRLSTYLHDLEVLNLRIKQTTERGLKLVGERDDLQVASSEITRSLATMQAVGLRLSALIELGLELASQRDPLYLLDTCCRAAQDIFSAKYAVVGVLDEEGQALAHVFVRGYASENKARLLALHPRAGLLGQALAEHRPLRIAGLNGEARAVGLPGDHPPINSFLVVPIVLSGRDYGWLYLADKLGAEAFDPDDEHFAVTLAAQLALAQENLLLSDEIRRHSSSLERSHQELRELSGALQSIREEERKRIARELHDDLGQSLAALRIDLAFLRDRLPGEDGRLLASVERMDQLVVSTVGSVRRIAADLRPKVLDELGLFPALQTLTQDFSQRHPVSCRLFVPEDEPPLDDAIATSLFRITQEALNNVARHAAATAVDVEVELDGERLTLTVRDNGRGIGDGDLQKPKSFGLLGMRERVSLLGGNFQLQGGPAAGTTVRVSLTLKPSLQSPN